MNASNGRPHFGARSQISIVHAATDAAVAPDPTSLPLFAGNHTESRPGRVRSGFSLRRLVPDPEVDVETSAGDGTAGRRRLGEGGLDWELIGQLRAEASDRLAARLEKAGGVVSKEEREEIGRAIIAELLHSAATENVSAGRTGWTPAEQDEMARALFDALFGLGRLQPLVEDDTIENISLVGAHTVWLAKTDGSLVPGPRVFDSEAELIEFLAKLAGDANRAFDEAHPSLHLRLPDGSRLAAVSWVTAEAAVEIRRHRLTEVTIAQMVHDNKSCGPVAGNFLEAAVRAGKSIVVSGVQGSGKTTWVRALCSAIPPWEKVGTFETEFELHLHEMKERHPIVRAWEHRPGSGEVGVGGRQAGEFTLQEAMHDSFRFTLGRQIVGEVRGPEVWSMVKAMESGPGSISTTHARNAEHTIEKLVSCAMETGPQVTRELAVTKLAAAVDIVMYLRVEVTPNPDGSFHQTRWLEEILVVDPSHDAAKGYQDTQVFKPGPDGRAVASGKMPDRLREDLIRHGFDMDAYVAEAQIHRGVRP